MPKKICYGEICRNNEIQIRNWILFVLAVAVVVITVIMINAILMGTDILRLPIFPAAF
jgi:hypothetical protein